jgi:hypothetical protein
MGRRKNNDVFVIGDELLDAETMELADARSDDSPATDQEPAAVPSGLDRRFPARGRASRSTRWLAGAGFAAVPLAAFVLLESSSSGGAAHGDLSKAPARSALVHGPAMGAAVSPAPAVSPPSSHARRSTRDRVRSAKRSASRPRVKSESEREPNEEEAPESSPSTLAAAPLSSEVPVAAVTPSPSPPPSGGGSGSVEEFGFER